MAAGVVFDGFTRHWTPFLPARELGPRKPVAADFDGVPVMLFRDADGVARALVDRCPHRSIKLSLGKRQPDGTIQCAFHGWRFDGAGRCLAIPLTADAKPEAVRARTVACHEAGGMIWLNATEADAAPAFPPLDPSLAEPGWHGAVVYRDWKAHWSRAHQTMLDVPHIPFVHPMTIGFAFGRAMGGSGQPRLAFDMTPREGGGFRADWRIAGAESGQSDAGWLEFLPPNGMTLGIPQKARGAIALLHIWCIPLTATTSRMMVVSRRNFGRFSPIPRLFDLLTPIILAEDRRNVETAWPSEVPPLGTEISTGADLPTIAFQRYYRGMFKAA